MPAGALGASSAAGAPASCAKAEKAVLPIRREKKPALDVRKRRLSIVGM
jgi:hypothetical protein